MNVTRENHTATLLPSGKVLVTGGDDGVGGHIHNSAELYDLAPVALDCSTATADVTFPRLGNRHRYPVTISGVTALNNGPVTLAITSIFQDEPVVNPTGKTCPDGVGVGTGIAKVRNERLLAGDGRVYHIGFTATDEAGASCTGDVKACVPAKEGEDCGDQGALFDSTVCPAVIYSDRSAFESAAPDLTTSTFDGLVGTPAYPQNYPFGPGYYTTSPSGITVDGVRYLASGDFGTETYILGPGVDTGDSGYILNGTFDLVGGRTTTDIFLPPGVTAFGADFGFDAATGADGGSLTVTIFLRDGTTETALLTVAPQSVSRSQFFGYRGSAIARIQLDSGGTRFFPYTLLDNVSFGPPE